MLIGWLLTDGCWSRRKRKRGDLFGLTVFQSPKANPDNVKSIDALFSRLRDKYGRYEYEYSACVIWKTWGDLAARIHKALPDKVATAGFFASK